MKNNNAKSFYDKLSQNYDREQDEQKFAFVRQPEKQLILDTIRHIFNPDDRVLEIGAGTGRFTIPIAHCVKEIVALDVSEKMLARLSIKAKAEKLTNICVQKGDFLGTEIGGSFQAIVSFSAIEYIFAKDKLFKKMSRLLDSKGKLLLTTAHDTFFRLFGRMGNFYRQKIYLTAYRKKEMEKLLYNNGFIIHRIQDLVLKTFFSKGILLFVYAQKKNCNLGK